MSIATDQQWYLVQADGTQQGPGTYQQLLDLAAGGGFPPGALVRRGDWPAAVPPSSLGWGAPPQQSWSTPSPAAASYAQQMASNPVKTFLLGPELPALPERNRDVRAARRRHFWLWVGGYLAMLAACVLIPAVVGMVRMGGLGFGIGLASGVLFFFTPSVIFALGICVYAAGLFEWGILFNSRRGRKMRASFGDEGLRKFYLGAGMFIMIPCLLCGLGVIAFTTIPLLLTEVDQPVAQAAPPQEVGMPAVVPPANVPDPVGMLESQLRDTRRQLEERGRALSPLLAEVQAAQTQLAANPNQANLRQLTAQAERRLAAQAPEYKRLQAAWQEQRAQLQQAVHQAGRTSQILQDNAELPADARFDAAALDAALARSQKSFDEPQLAGWEQDLTRFENRVQFMLKLDSQSRSPAAVRLATLGALDSEMMTTRFAADRIAEIERRHGYQSSALAQFRQTEKKLEALRAALKAEAEQRRGPR